MWISGKSSPWWRQYSRAGGEDIIGEGRYAAGKRTTLVSADLLS